MEVLDNRSTLADSRIVARGGNVYVELNPDHPGFRDAAYRERRNAIARLALDYTSGAPIPSAPYTNEEHALWRHVCAELIPKLRRFAHQGQLEYWDKLRLPTDRIPQLGEVTQALASTSGFRLEPVAGLIKADVFLRDLGRKVFASTQYIRHYSTPAYTPEPDVVHEIIGHAAQLAHPELAALNVRFGDAVARAKSAGDVDKLIRVYWYTMEFGVLREAGVPKAYGAGLLSSFGEIERVESPALVPFDLARMEATPFDVTMFQPVLFCAASFTAMHDALKSYLDRF